MVYCLFHNGLSIIYKTVTKIIIYEMTAKFTMLKSFNFKKIPYSYTTHTSKFILITIYLVLFMESKRGRYCNLATNLK